LFLYWKCVRTHCLCVEDKIQYLYIERKYYWSTFKYKMNCELMLTYDTPALRQTVSRNLTGQKRFPRYGVPIWSFHIGTTYRGKRFWTHQIPTSCLSILLIFIHIEHTFCICPNRCWEKCDEKCAYMFNVYKNQLSRQTGSRNLTGPKTLFYLLQNYCMQSHKNC
jgi:hypothetical protein